MDNITIRDRIIYDLIAFVELPEIQAAIDGVFDPTHTVERGKRLIRHMLKEDDVYALEA